MNNRRRGFRPRSQKITSEGEVFQSLQAQIILIIMEIQILIVTVL